MTSLIERLLRRETNIKILSLVLAVSLWLYVTSEQNPEATQMMPLIEVMPRNVPADLAIVSMDPARVSVTISGRPSLFDDFDPAKVEAVADLADAEAGIVARVVKVQVPNGVHVVDITPSEVVVALEPLAEKDMAVEVSLEGATARQYEIGQPLVFPSHVHLTGAQTKVAEVARVVSGVDVEGISENMVFEGVRVLAVDGAGRQVAGVSVIPETVRVIVPVGTAAAGDTLPVEPVLTGEPADGLQVIDVVAEPARVPIQGPTDVIAATTTVTTEPIDLGGHNETFSVEATLTFPPELAPVGDGVTVTVTVHLGPSS